MLYVERSLPLDEMVLAMYSLDEDKDVSFGVSLDAGHG